MRFRGLVIFPLLYAVVFIAIATWAEADARLPFVLGQKILVRLLAIIGSYWAVSAFERGDHLRRAWHWLALAATLVLVRDLIVLPSRLEGSTQPLAGALGVVVIGLPVVSNVGLLTGVWLLSRSWKMAALALPGGRSRMIMVTAVAAALAIAVTGPPLALYIKNLFAGDPAALINVVSTVVDILSLGLLAPLLLTAFALRGGHFFWPWALLTACLLSWLLYDAATNYDLAPGGLPLAEVFRGLALNLQFTAGLAQSMVIRRVRQEAG
jgi:hypothetical protein